jgi:hypothetical protein
MERGIVRHLIALLVGLTVAGCGAGTGSSVPHGSPSPTPDPASPYLNIAGDVLTFKGQTVVLRGENFNNEPAMSCCGVPNISRINVSGADYALVSNDLGGNYVRFGLDYQWYRTNRTVFFQVIDQQVQLAKKYHLWMIPVMYQPPGGSSGGYGGQNGFWTSAANQHALTNFWVDFATHYATDPTIAGYDLFNEPAPPNGGAWTTWTQAATNAITTVDRAHFVVLEDNSADWNLPAVTAPRVLWSSHCYARVATDNCNFPGANPAYPPRLPFLIGEVGSTQATGTSYVSADLYLFNQHGISWTHFVMREPVGQYGLYQTEAAGDFSQPWTPMMLVVQKAMAGSLKPS